MEHATRNDSAQSMPAPNRTRRVLLGMALYMLTLTGIVLTIVCAAKMTYELKPNEGSRSYILASWLPTDLAGVLAWASHNVFPMLTATLVLFLWFCIFMARRGVRKAYPREAYR